MPPIENPRLRFLSDAAQLLTVHSPSTSAHLLAAHTQILHEDLKTLNVRQQKHHCGACGSIRQPQTSRITEVKSKGKSRACKSESPGAKVYKCLRCHQRAVLPRKRTASKPLPRTSTTTASPAVSRASSESTSLKAPSQQDSLSAASDPQPDKAAENASSKKRAKARKQGSLQALLASKQPTQSSLDLFDFLQ